jgi:hypothetical protein
LTLSMAVIIPRAFSSVAAFSAKDDRIEGRIAWDLDRCTAVGACGCFGWKLAT